MKSHHLLFLLAFIGHAQAQGVVCGVLGILCPPSTVAPTTTGLATTTTTPEETEEFCFEVPGSNVDITINPTQLTQDQIDQIQDLSEDLLSNIQSANLTDAVNNVGDLLGGFLDGLGGILNPGTTQTPVEGTGRICIELPTSDVEELENLLNEIFSQLTNSILCVRGSVNELQSIVQRISQTLIQINDGIESCQQFGVFEATICQITKLGGFTVELIQSTTSLRPTIQAFFKCFEHTSNN